jgi:hypothetical protein
MLPACHPGLHAVCGRGVTGQVTHRPDGLDVQPLRDAAHVAAREVDHQGNAARADLRDDEAVAFDQECLGDPVDAADRVVLEGVHSGLVLDEGGPYSIQECRQAIQGLPEPGDRARRKAGSRQRAMGGG